LLLWLHNTMTQEFAALRAYRDQLRGKIINGENGPQVSRSAITPLRTSMSFLMPAYFAAFETSTEAEEYFGTLLSDKPDLGLQGTASHTDTFDKAEVLNTLRDVSLLQAEEKKREEGSQPEADPLPLGWEELKNNAAS